MKLRKEDVYIHLQGKSKEELTDLYNFLKSLNYDVDPLESFFNSSYLHFNIPNFIWWTFDTWSNGKPTKQEVTIQQLKEILQPMGDKEFNLKGYSVEVDNKVQAKQLQELAFKQGFEWPTSGKVIQFLNEKFFSFNAYNDNQIHFDSAYFKDKYVTKEIHFNDIFKTEPTLIEQLEKAKAEVERLQKVIEEDNKPKVGDWLMNYKNIYKYSGNEDYGYILSSVKITDQDLINKLNELIKL